MGRVLILLLAASQAHAGEWRAEPFVDYGHLSSLTLHGDRTSDSVMFGVTVSRGRWEIDLAQGVKALDCGRGRCPTESATSVGVRVYPWRRR